MLQNMLIYKIEIVPLLIVMYTVGVLSMNISLTIYVKLISCGVVIFLSLCLLLTNVMIDVVF